jgi:hypothetical protein
LVDAEPGDFVAEFLQGFACVQHGFVLGHLRDDVPAVVRMRAGDTLDGQIV